MSRDLDLIRQAARDAARRAVEQTAAAQPVQRYGTVEAVSGGAGTVRLDGDTVTVTARVLTKTPTVGARVLVQFQQGACQIVGIHGGYA